MRVTTALLLLLSGCSHAGSDVASSPEAPLDLVATDPTSSDVVAMAPTVDPTSWDWAWATPDNGTTVVPPDVRVSMETEQGVVAARLRFDRPFQLSSWTGFGAETVMSALFPVGLRAPEPCSTLQGEVDLIWSLVGSNDTLDFDRLRPAGEYVVLLAAPGHASASFAFGGGDVEVTPKPVAVAVEASYLPVSEFHRSGPVPDTVSFEEDHSLTGPSLVLTAFYAREKGVALEQATTAWRGPDCAMDVSIDQQPFAGAVVAGRGGPEAGLSIANVAAGTYTFAGSYEATVGPGPYAQAGVFLLTP